MKFEIGDRVRILDDFLRDSSSIQKNHCGTLVTLFTSGGQYAGGGVKWDGKAERRVYLSSLEPETWELEELAREVVNQTVKLSRLKEILKENPNLKKEFIGAL